ncbi:Periplasmic binding protein OS=Tsukamurella paurometabola (strain ATCC 8368 / DSM / CCUG 35730/ CIP 100753 / JCM 10117 / KCTC 9821 / NBRC 16120 / NCIMB 702349 / NCTC 13040) OX=521096 GN=Tpau_3694 PE=3 SV=1 [Tsukamurella paurometabola]|uniref:Periplasmic binding protein n=1 Tax=Tsukamurella paurometabola (strain ATCC 8368 / DSM 20162 / CCUG 35730 / CIP 100753 / JCM 10117 / KCTC 9821 / NBRC 16120 / NCIMB 702349 / NCTC 13040) TaxID=521096 RepID=D5UY35_TSUPD|nr:iron-siderophore ABC transporter substrate-binding protein [Tsukamurella paurometabola]ADG80272.1 periplasmic binding protein [Tsukamurella paurometabola DSM 20162]SUP39091.1 Probable siderophore-binding lipoprotein yfiY precursor [Tsukamurella paurometabola]
MTPRFRRARAALAVTAAAAVLVTAGCGSNGSSGDSAPSQDAGFPVSIQSALGTAEIRSKPQRVVTLGWGSTEAAVALGVIPVGMRDMKSDSGTVDGILPWVKDKLGDAKPELLPESSKSIPIEQIAALKPDVILSVQSGLTPDQYAQLSKIAPTVAQPGKNWQTSWQDQTTLVGKALGKEADAKKLIEDADKKIADVKAANPGFAGKTVVAASGTTPDGLNLYFDTDPRIKLLAGFGFTPLPALTQLRESTQPGKFAAPVSWENVSKYNADVLTSWYLDATQQSVEANPVFTSLTAVQKKAYVPLTDPPLVFAVSSPNVLDLPWLVERYVPLLQTAAKNAG